MGGIGRAAVSGVAADGAGRVLCVLRDREPFAGRWSLPGGRVEAGEDPADAVVRELAEETGLDVVAGDVVGRRDVPDPRPGHGAGFALEVRAVVVRGGTLRPGDDAGEVRWLTRQEVRGLPTTPGLVGILDACEAFRRRSEDEIRAWAGWRARR